MPKRRIEEAASRKQARIDGGHDVIVGINKFNPKPGKEQPTPELRVIDNTAVVRDARPIEPTPHTIGPVKPTHHLARRSQHPRVLVRSLSRVSSGRSRWRSSRSFVRSVMKLRPMPPCARSRPRRRAGREI